MARDIQEVIHHPDVTGVGEINLDESGRRPVYPPDYLSILIRVVGVQVRTAHYI
jgi:hypothetical protein